MHVPQIVGTHFFLRSHIGGPLLGTLRLPVLTQLPWVGGARVPKA